MKVSDLLGLTLEQRLSHIDLTEPCLLYHHPYRKSNTLAEFDLEDDVGNWHMAGIHRCHVCDHNSRNGWCINPKHYFIGSIKENSISQQTLLKIISAEWYGDVGGKTRINRSLAQEAKQMMLACDNVSRTNYTSPLDDPTTKRISLTTEVKKLFASLEFVK